ncbi:MAG: hypothetical protein HYV19_01865 [Gemmatimonadetes bacterium]|nr:hypothetical protein [Gemmatimonadota bacterium]
MVSAALVTPVAGQKPDSTKLALDSLAARVERAEETIEMLRQQLAAQGESAVKSKSGMTVELNGRILMNAFANTRRVNNSDAPTTVRSDTSGGPPNGGAGMEIRQTTLGLAVTSPNVLGAHFLGDLDVDFFGGQVSTIGGRTMPLIRLRTARAILTWPHAELLVGQEQPLVSNLNPVSLAGVGTPDFSASGNLWYWMPQVRVTVERPGAVRLGFSGAIIAPMTGEPVGTFDTDFDAAERSRRPFFEGRLRLRWGSEDSQAEVGVGFHQGWLAPTRDSLLSNDALTLDALIPLGPRVEVRGEAFSGRGMRVLGGGQVGQLYGRGGVVVRGTGGWGQVNVKPTSRLLVGAGMGYDDPKDSELPATGRLKNATTEMHAIAHPGGPLVLSLEWRRTTTTFTARSWTNDHLNIGIGFEF